MVISSITIWNAPSEKILGNHTFKKNEMTYLELYAG
jgi:hypothetical protein